MALEDCDQIYADLLALNIRFECKTLAEAFIGRLRAEGYVSSTSKELPVLAENQVAIVSFSAPIAFYHYIIICRHDRDNYKVYTAFGNIFIDPFLVDQNTSIRYNHMLQHPPIDKTYRENLNEVPFAEAWNAMTHRDLNTYFYQEFAFQCARLSINEILEHIQEIDISPKIAKMLQSLFLELSDMIRNPSSIVKDSVYEILSIITCIGRNTDVISMIFLVTSCTKASLRGNYQTAFNIYSHMFTTIGKQDDIETFKDFWNTEITTYFNFHSSKTVEIYTKR